MTIELRLAGFRDNRATIDDPVAERAGWTPLVPHQAGETRVRVALPDRLTFRRSAAVTGLLAVLVLFSLVLIGFGIAVLYDRGDVGGAYLIAVGAAFASLLAVGLRRDDSWTFDRRAGEYRHGRPRATGRLPVPARGPLASIHAVQVLAKDVASPSDSGGTEHRLSCEMNLVFGDGARVSVLKGGAYHAVMDASRALSGFLAVPLWQARC